MIKQHVLAMPLMALLAASSQAQAPAAGATAAVPDPRSITFTLPANLKWEGAEGEKRVYLYGHPDKPGAYGVLYRWEPGHNSKPHTHTQDRYGYIISGNWWMSSSPKEDKSTLYPVPAGSSVVHKAGEVHWDGGVDGISYVLVTGIGPINTKWLDGK